ncbi:hypothetical protein, partial [Hungatella effluvii]|uniref:hypothetical protein n=1 Tax=Hungatella effluvii TaxID=1096246 RepID=UPI002A82DDF1
ERPSDFVKTAALIPVFHRLFPGIFIMIRHFMVKHLFAPDRPCVSHTNHKALPLDRPRRIPPNMREREFPYLTRKKESNQADFFRRVRLFSYKDW